jgi:hypothetical protein
VDVRGAPNGAVIYLPTRPVAERRTRHECMSPVQPHSPASHLQVDILIGGAVRVHVEDWSSPVWGRSQRIPMGIRLNTNNRQDKIRKTSNRHACTF